MHFIQKLIYSFFTILILLSFSQKSAKAEVIDRILAQVGDRVITQFDVESYSPSTLKSLYAIEDEKQRETAINIYYDTTLQFLIDMNILEIAAARLNYFAPSAEIDEIVKRLRASNSTFRKEYDKIIDEEGGDTVPKIVWMVKQRYLITLIGDKFNKRVIITEDDIRSFLDPHGDNFEYNLIQYTFNNKSEYQQFVSKFSKSPSAAIKNQDKSFDLGWVVLEDLSESISQVIYDTKLDQISTPMIDDEGVYTIFHLKGKRVKLAYDSEAIQLAREHLQNTKQEEIATKWLERQKASILVINY